MTFTGASLWERLGLPRPDGVLDGSRLAFLALNVANAIAVLGAIALAEPGKGIQAVSGVAVFVMLAAHWRTARRRRAGTLDEAVVPASMLLASLALPDVAMTISLAFSAVMFRSLYGTNRQAVFRTAAYVVVYALALQAADLTGRMHVTASSLVLPLPALLATAVTIRLLYVAAQAREAASHRQEVLTQAATQLLGARDMATLATTAWQAQRQLLAGHHADAFLLDERHGNFAVVRDVFSPSERTVSRQDVLTAVESPHRHPVVIRDPGPSLSALSDAATSWYLIPTGADPTALRILVLASPERLPEDLIKSSQLLMNQTALAFDALKHRIELNRQASHDGLTGLENRTSFTRHLTELSTSPRRGTNALYFIDLDGFKPINDDHGHLAGDELLVVIADRLRTAAPPRSVVARLGGDEFAVLVSRSETSFDAYVQADQWEAAIRAPITLKSGATVHVGASIGVHVPQAPFDPEQMLHAADSAMYAAKADRRTGHLEATAGA
nr:GGDEF domain-containing protein [uncultured Actinoplanes sp.]